MLRRAVCSFVFTLLALVAALPAHADLVLRKKVERHFPAGISCPFINELELSFIASSPEAIVTFSAQGVDQEPFQINDVAIVDRETFTDQFKATVAPECVNGDLAFYAGSPLDVDLTDDPTEWTLINASLADTLQMGVTGDSQAEASILVRDLVPGREYFVTGWSGRGDFEIAVDSRLPTSFSLANGRFRIEVLWGRDELLAGVLPHSEQTAGLWFHDPSQLVMIVSATDNCGPTGNGTYWLMIAGTTSQKLRITVQDTVTGIQKTYVNGAQIRLKTVVDKKTFRCRR